MTVAFGDPSQRRYCRVRHYDAALPRYEKAYPELFVQRGPSIDVANYRAAIDLALVLQKPGESEAAKILLDRADGCHSDDSPIGHLRLSDLGRGDPCPARPKG